ncbi:pyridoxal-dependent decarboxylase [Dickeya zeae]|uniref:pyridoxal-dependent decarboxylase n=1 Tax=Dickeya zeae TaxID=204042 RepID=UPI001F24A70A|nr:pyridoxal-dependent decarboxylase [Dickeya zeae]UJR64070.1 glutamate decarboxylase [Dickeya zeae]
MQPVDELTILADGLHDVVRRRILRDYIAHMEEQQRHFAGFQTNQQGGFDAGLRPLLEMNLLNLGDSMEPGAYQVNSKRFERAVLAYYAQLWRLPSPYWGYLTAMGSTEGNLFALWNARDFLCGAATTHWPSSAHARYAPVVLYSERSHYSLAKACRVLQLATPAQAGPALGRCPFNGGVWPQALPCDDAGRVDVESLLQLVVFFHRYRRPVIICLTSGTTFSGACDDWAQITAQLQRLLPPNTPQQRHYWLHMDGALSSNYLPFWPEPEERQLAVDAQAASLHSICASPYKWLSMPWPCGIVMLPEAYRAVALNRPNYIGSGEATLSGSRPGLSAVVLWNQLCRLGEQGQREMIRRCHEVQRYAYQQLCYLFERLDPGRERLVVLPLIRGSLMVQFSAPHPSVIERFSLSSDQVVVQGTPRRFCHLVVLPHCHQALVDSLLWALRQPGAFAPVTEV